MTAPGSSFGSWPLRIRRAEQIASEYEFAAEFLAFYKHVALFQKYLYEKIAASTEVTSRTTPARPLRAELDLALLLPHFREYLTVIEHSAPSALKESAHQMALLPTDSWIASLQGYWESGGRDEQDIGAFDQFLPRAFLQPYAEYRASLAPSPPLFMTTRACPLCGARPLLGVLRPEGDGGKRFLMCSFCSLEWEFRRIFCAKCGEEKEQKLPVYVAEQFPHIRMECCETCRHFLRTIDLTKDGNAVPLVDDLAAVPLSLWAEENGYERIQGNLLGT